MIIMGPTNTSRDETSKIASLRALVTSCVFVAVVTLPMLAPDLAGAATSSRPKPSVADVTRTMKVGVTPGSSAVLTLRKNGFVVFDYRVCSNSVSGVSGAGKLRQIRDRKSQRVLFDELGATKVAQNYRGPTALDVLIASGSTC